jgi:hypothetical protein
LALRIAGGITFVLSFPVKAYMLAQAVKQQKPEKVQVGYTLAFVMCEMTGLFGFLLFSLRGSSPFYYYMFGVAALGLLLHMPRRSHLTDASFKRGGFGAKGF